MVKDSEVVQPKFIVDEEGKAYCTTHTLFNKIPEKVEEIPPILGLFGAPAQAQVPLTCKTCGHYFKDSCYFSSDSIDRIEHERERGQIACDFCGDKIHRSMTVFQKIYYETEHSVKMPLLCCGCYAGLKNNNFVEQAKKNMILWSLVTIISICILLNYLSILVMWGLWGTLASATGLFFWAYFGYEYGRRILRAWRGKKRYEQLEKQFKIAEAVPEV